MLLSARLRSVTMRGGRRCAGSLDMTEGLLSSASDLESAAAAEKEDKDDEDADEEGG